MALISGFLYQPVGGQATPFPQGDDLNGALIADRSVVACPLGTAPPELANRIAFPVYTDLPEAAKRSLGLGSTPQTIVVSPSGRVMANWVGAYGPDLKPKIEGFFRVRLPGLTDETAGGASASSSPPAEPTSPR